MKLTKETTSALLLAATISAGAAIAAEHGELGHIHGPQCQMVDDASSASELRAARENLLAKMHVVNESGVLEKSAGAKLGAAGGNTVCRVVQSRFECENSDALFQRGVSDNRTWATVDLLVWARDSWVNAHGGWEKAKARLQVEIGMTNRIFAESDTKIQIRVPEVIRLPDAAVDSEQQYLLAASYGTDFATIIGDVSDKLNTIGCVRHGCGMAQRNGASDQAYAGVLGAFDHTATVSWIFGIAGENGSRNATGEVISAVLGATGGTLAHELSHNMGADHFVPSGGIHLPYSKGFGLPTSTPATRYCGDATTSGAGTFSNARISCGGQPRGVEGERDASRAFKESRFEFASLSRASKRIPGNFTGMWWTPTENGVGWTITHQDDKIFLVWYTYGLDGKPLWLVASDLSRQADDSFQGSLFRIEQGTPLTQIQGTPAVSFPDGVEEVGTISISFNDQTWGQASFELTMDGRTYRNSKWLTRLNFQANPPSCSAVAGSRASATNYQDMWWNEKESGWGMHISHEGDVIFAAWFTYGDDRKPKWHVASAMRKQADGSFTGPIYEITGIPIDQIGGGLGQPLWVATSNLMENVGRDAGHFPPAEVGNARLAFTNGEQGTMTYAAGDISATKQISRMVFGASTPFCQ